jgi:hypothetical protein
MVQSSPQKFVGIVPGSPGTKVGFTAEVSGDGVEVGEGFFFENSEWGAAVAHVDLREAKPVSSFSGDSIGIVVVVGIVGHCYSNLLY